MICTFYSYKGGVGRSMALANVAELLCQRGVKVLLVDFDLEAPGLERFFFDGDTSVQAADVTARRGIIDWLVSYVELRSLPFVKQREPEDGAFPYPLEPITDFVVPIYPDTPSGGSLHLIPAGRRAGDDFARYAERVRRFDWDRLYARLDGEPLFDWFSEETQRLADIVLIDSRTGISEMTGVCTFHLADVVVMFVAPNRQNVDGARIMCRSLQSRELIDTGRRGRPLSLICVPSRVEHSESGFLDDFRREFTSSLGEFISPQLRFETDAFLDLKVPYVPYYAYAETVAVREADRPVSADIAGAYSRLASAIVELGPRRSRLFRQFNASELSRAGKFATRPLAAAEQFTAREWVFDWLDHELDDLRARPLVLVGAPGTGKTAIAARLLDLSEGAAAGAAWPSLGPGFLTYAHFCQSTDSRTLDARQFVESLLRALAAKYVDFGRFVLGGGSSVGVDVRTSIGNVSQDAYQAALKVDEVELGDAPARQAFDELVRHPLLALGHSLPPDQRVTILVDGLDEAAGTPSPDDLVSLVNHAIRGELPPAMRLIVTTRRHPRVLAALRGPAVLDLDAAHERNVEDVRAYVNARLGDDPDLVTRIAEASDGSFLYARTVVENLDASESGPAELPRVPGELATLYSSSVTRLVGLDVDEWAHEHAPFLGLLAVARDGLTCRHLAGFLRRRQSEAAELVWRWAPYLVGKLPDGPLGLFHSSFKAFLQEDNRFRVDAGEAHLTIATFFLSEYAGAWKHCDDDYALAHTIWHVLAAALAAPRRTMRTELRAEAYELLADPGYLAAKRERLGDFAVDLETRTVRELVIASERASESRPEPAR